MGSDAHTRYEHSLDGPRDIVVWFRQREKLFKARLRHPVPIGKVARQKAPAKLDAPRMLVPKPRPMDAKIRVL